MYWALNTGTSESKLQRANLDGTGVEELVCSGLVGAFAVALDTSVGSCGNCCGNSVLNTCTEQCDDGNTTPDDGCSATCQCENTCGNGIVQKPCEQCDLGPDNCQPGECCSSGCASDCEVTGRCTGSGACCTFSADCPPGEGCCGNTIIEGNEQCDDGNTVEGDCCSSTCQNEPPPCSPLCVCEGVLGPHLIANPTVRSAVLRDADPRDGTLDRWKTKGEFSLHQGQTIDPDSETVEYSLTQNDGSNQCVELYRPVLDPAQCPNQVCFEPRTNSQGMDVRWRFRRRQGESDIVGAPGWRGGELSRSATLPNRIKFALKGRGAVLGTPQPLSSVRRVRQSIKIGDDCVTRVLDCAPNGMRTVFRCQEAHCGNGVAERGERCGEPGLATCSGGKVCDTCRCVAP
jgi:cysteine-rich repeat protein